VEHLKTTIEATPFRFTGKERDSETGLYYFGARYLNPQTSMWLSADPAMGEYIPLAPIDDEAKQHNKNLPGMGGVFNYVNLHVYHYAGNNPVVLRDPNGNAIIATSYSNRMFRENRGEPIANKTFSRHSPIIIYNGPRNRTSLELYNLITFTNPTVTNATSKISINRIKMGDREFNRFVTVINTYIDAKNNNREIFFSTTLMEGKVDDDGYPYYLLSMTVDGTTTDIFYFSGEEISSRTRQSKDRLLTLIVCFFAAFKEGTPAEWKPDANTKIQTELF
jgi:RHS repeat-associated protein